MAKQVINIGAAPDDGTGDTLRVGGDKINNNFSELYDADVALDGRVAALEGAPLGGDMLAANNLSELSDPGDARDNLDVYSKGEVDSAVAGGGGGGGGDMLSTNNLSDLADDAAARANLDVYSTAEVDAAVASGGGSFRGALVKKSADQTAANFTSGASIAWTAESYDTSAFHDNSTNNSRLTVPAGVSRVRVSACVTMANVLSDNWAVLAIQKNGSSDWDGCARLTTEGGLTTPCLNVVSAVIDVTAGDYFSVFLQVETDTSVDVTAARSWFAIEVIE